MVQAVQITGVDLDGFADFLKQKFGTTPSVDAQALPTDVGAHLVDRAYIELNLHLSKRRILYYEREGILKRKYNPQDVKTAYYTLADAMVARKTELEKQA